jgi:predicted alpha/beta superfamily hydrolase
MRHLILFLSMSLLFTVCGAATARAQSADTTVSVYHSLPGPDESFRLDAPATGTSYEIGVYLPESYGRTDTAYPVLYALDGDASFDELAARAVRESVNGEMIVVGIGFGLPEEERRPLRLRDYTPNPVSGLEGSGGADDFLEFVEATLIPDIERRFRVGTRRRIFAGHSLGGFLVLYALFSEPSAFDGYIALSPSVAIDDFAELRSDFAPADDGVVDLAIAVGGSEDPARMLDPVERFVASLREDALPGIRLHTAVIDDKDHLSVVDPGLSWALQVLSGE